MSIGTTVTPHVALCDSQGVLVWTNHPNPAYRPGVPIWECADDRNREEIKVRVSRAVFLNEPQEFETVTSLGEYYRIWIWPFETNDLRICFVGLRLPDEVALLTARERNCLERLAIGRSTAEIAAEFDVSVSTVHTHMKRARAKLHIRTMEHLIAFASRFLPPPAQLDAMTRVDPPHH